MRDHSVRGYCTANDRSIDGSIRKGIDLTCRINERGQGESSPRASTYTAFIKVVAGSSVRLRIPHHQGEFNIHICNNVKQNKPRQLPRSPWPSDKTTLGDDSLQHRNSSLCTGLSVHLSPYPIMSLSTHCLNEPVAHQSMCTVKHRSVTNALHDK